jgi:DNA-binding transcriptional LysR family regulator
MQGVVKENLDIMSERKCNTNSHICRFIMQKRTSSSNLPRWDHLRVVSVIARSGTLTAAAAELGLDHTTVARQLSSLEKELGTLLFERSRLGLVATPFGEEVIAVCDDMESEVNGLLRRMDGETANLTGSVRLTATIFLASSIIAPAMGKFLQLHPGLDIDLIADDRALDMSRREADVGLRLSRPQAPGLVGRKVGTIAFNWYVSATHPQTDDELAWLVYQDAAGTSPLMRHMLAATQNERITLRSNSMHALIDAVRFGAGCSLLPCLIGDHDTMLRRAQVPHKPLSLPLWITYHGDLRRSPRIKAVSNFLATLIAERQAELDPVQ